ncbi:hypothetical protein BKA63DRAFT_433380 [Paraphoma chrysanthemicola]|nr:hypothetical protein BKA63DRAFT_433380 [Paraphoma chrysanthemicola]
MFSYSKILLNSTTNALGPKTARMMDPINSRATRWRSLRRIANRDPELYPLYFLTAATVGWFAWKFVQRPTGDISDSSYIAQIGDSEPWKDNPDAALKGKYKYHPYGDVTQPSKESPSALNVVIVPGVTLPKYLHDRYNKMGKPEYDY